jgi:hypothetical protein
MRTRCPHDGCDCGHQCSERCYRKIIGVGFDKPVEGFPQPGDLPIVGPIYDEACKISSPGTTTAQQAWASHRPCPVHHYPFWEDIPAPEPVVRVEFKRAADLDAANMLSRQAELLSRYAANLEQNGNRASKSDYDRANLAREISLIFFRAAELEKNQ